MAQWLIQSLTIPIRDPGNRKFGRDALCFRIFPEGEPKRWIAQTNANLPPEAQEEFALLIAKALSQALDR